MALDTTRALMDLIEGAVPNVQTGIEIPADLDSIVASVGGFVLVDRLGGSGDRFVERPVYDIECWRVGYDPARELAASISRLMLDTPHKVGQVVIEWAVETTVPYELPWDDVGNLRRQHATYQLSARR